MVRTCRRRTRRLQILIMRTNTGTCRRWTSRTPKRQFDAIPGGTNLKQQCKPAGDRSPQGRESTPDPADGLTDSRHENTSEASTAQTNSVPRPDRGRFIPPKRAVAVHFEKTPRERPIHVSTLYRWAADDTHPVQGLHFGGELFIDRESLEEFCRAGFSPRRRRKPASSTQDTRYTAAVLDRIRRKHGIVTPNTGGDDA